MKKLFEQSNEEVFGLETKQKEVAKKDNEELSPEQQKELNAAYGRIAATSTQTLPGAKSLVFSDKKGKRVFNITGTALEPHRSTMVGKGKFADRYKQQLENYLFTDGDINPDNLIPFIMLMEAGEGGEKIVRVVSSQNKALLKNVVETLNNFFKEHQSVIKGMYTMFKGSMSARDQVKENV